MITACLLIMSFGFPGLRRCGLNAIEAVACSSSSTCRRRSEISITKPTTPRGQLGATLGDEMADFFMTLGRHVAHAHCFLLLSSTHSSRHFRQQRRLSAIGTLNKALHELPPQIAKRIIAERPFSRSHGHSRPKSAFSDMSGLPPIVCELRTSLDVRFVHNKRRPATLELSDFA
jgi:hypothetical protein